MENFSRDVWQVILSKINSPKDFYNISSVCKNTSKAAKILKNAKAREFSKQQLNYSSNGRISQKYYTLPNECIHGKFVRYDTIDYGAIIKTERYFAFGEEITKETYYNLRI